MTRFLALLSGKGGVGKTVVAINLATALQGFGRDVVVVDVSLATPDLALYLGIPFLPVTLNNVIRGENDIKDAVYRHPSGVKLIPASISSQEYDFDKIKNTLKNLNGLYELVILDCPAGFGKDAVSLMKIADEVFVVTNPELPSVTDALRAIKLSEENGITVIGIILNKVRKDSYEISYSNVEIMLGYPIIEQIPYDENMRKAVHNKFPILSTHPNSSSSIAFKKLASVLIGEKYDVNIKNKETDNILAKLGFSK